TRCRTATVRTLRMRAQSSGGGGVVVWRGRSLPRLLSKPAVFKRCSQPRRRPLRGLSRRSPTSPGGGDWDEEGFLDRSADLATSVVECPDAAVQDLITRNQVWRSDAPGSPGTV